MQVGILLLIHTVIVMNAFFCLILRIHRNCRTGIAQSHFLAACFDTHTIISFLCTGIHVDITLSELRYGLIFQKIKVASFLLRLTPLGNQLPLWNQVIGCNI